MFERNASAPDLWGPATEKLLSPICDCVRGTTNV